MIYPFNDLLFTNARATIAPHAQWFDPPITTSSTNLTNARVGSATGTFCSLHSSNHLLLIFFRTKITPVLRHKITSFPVKFKLSNNYPLNFPLKFIWLNNNLIQYKCQQVKSNMALWAISHYFKPLIHR